MAEEQDVVVQPVTLFAGLFVLGRIWRGQATEATNNQER